MPATSLGFFPLKCETVNPMDKSRNFGGQGIPDGSVVKNLPANAGNPGDVGSIPRLGRSPRRGNGNPLQYSCLGNPTDRGAWWAIFHGIAESDMTEATEHAHLGILLTARAAN